MAETYDIEIYNNDTYTGCVFTIYVNSVLLDLTGATVQMQVRKTRNNTPIIDLSLGSGLTIVDVNGKLAIDEQVFTGVPDEYLYDIQINLASGDIKTYIKGTFTIEGDITHSG